MLPRTHSIRRLARFPGKPAPRQRFLTTGVRPASRLAPSIARPFSKQLVRPSICRHLHASLPLRADQPFKLADIGEGITEVQIVSWTVKEGDEVEEFDTLCEVQSDKSTVELTAPFSGKVHHIAFGDGETVKVGQILCRISTGTEDGEREGEEAAATADSGREAETGRPQESSVGEDVREEDNAEVKRAEDLSESLEKAVESAPERRPIDSVEIAGEAAQDLSYEAAPLLESSPPSNAIPEATEAPIPPQPQRQEQPVAERSSKRSPRGDGYIPPPPPRQIVRPVQDAHDKMSSMDRALLASLRAAADASEASQAAYEAANFLAEEDAAMRSSGPSEFSGEAAVVRGHEPRPVSISDAPVPDRRDAPRGSARERDIVKASPAVRTMAARLGVQLEDVRATGDGGRVTQQDVQNAVMVKRKGVEATSSRPAAQKSMQAGPSRAPVNSPSPAASYPQDRKQIPEVTTVEFGRTRKVMYRAMGDMAHVPHFGYSHTLNLTPLLPFLRALNNAPAPNEQNYLASDVPEGQARSPINTAARPKTTLLSFLVKGLMLAMEEHPIMRARAREQGGSRFLDIARDGVIGVAVSDPKYGLVTPSLPQLAPSTPLSQLTTALTALRQNPTKPTGPANVTISSVGGLGEGRDMMPVLPPGGGVAICAVGRARWEVEWKKGKGKGIMDMLPDEVEKGGTEAVLRVPVGWSGDHRVLEGAELIAFTETWRKYIEEPWRWISVD